MIFRPYDGKCSINIVGNVTTSMSLRGRRSLTWQSPAAIFRKPVILSGVKRSRRIFALILLQMLLEVRRFLDYARNDTAVGCVRADHD